MSMLAPKRSAAAALIVSPTVTIAWPAAVAGGWRRRPGNSPARRARYRSASFTRRLANMRVLILAEDCNPDLPSVPMFSYRAVRAIANYAEVVLVTQIRNGDSITRAGMGCARVEY